MSRIVTYDMNGNEIDAEEPVIELDSLSDSVNHPAHYEGKIECIDAMVECFGVDAVADYSLCNAFKYLWRCMKKHDDPKEDVMKARWYLDKFLELEE
jgi:hypothetical protein